LVVLRFVTAVRREVRKILKSDVQKELRTLPVN